MQKYDLPLAFSTYEVPTEPIGVAICIDLGHDLDQLFVVVIYDQSVDRCFDQLRLFQAFDS